jgi:hypothetical protein
MSTTPLEPAPMDEVGQGTPSSLVPNGHLGILAAKP